MFQESDEPELIILAHSRSNELKLLNELAVRTEMDLSVKLDAIRNRLLYIDTLVSVAALVFGMGSYIMGMLGFNLPFVLNDDPTAFRRLIIPTSLLMIFLCIIL